MRFDEICAILKNAGIENAGQEAALLLEKFCGVSQSAVPLLKNEDFNDPNLLAAVEKRWRRYPLQYILGEWYFYNEKYLVSEHCLIPRSDTEILVETAIKNLPPQSVFADLCTGSGCVAISVLAACKDSRAYAFELFSDTLELAKKNAKLNSVSERFYPVCADVLEPLSFGKGGEYPLFNAILSNPPYIRTDVIDTLESEVSHEPRAALDGGVDGLAFYRVIIEKHSHLLRDDGFIALEIGYDQSEDIFALSVANGFSCEIIRDYGGKDRVALLRRCIE